MGDFLAKYLVSVIALLTAIVTGIGITINNIYLSNYFIADYALINTKAIYSGIVFFFFIIFLTVINLAWIDTQDLTRNQIRKIIFNFIMKPIICTNALYLPLNGFPPPWSSQYVLGVPIYNAVIVPSSFISSTLIFFLLFNTVGYMKNNKDLLGKFFKYTGKICLFLSFIPLISLTGNNQIYTDLLYFFGYYSLLMFVIVIHFYGVEFAKKRGQNIPDHSPYNFDINNKKISIWEIIFSVLWCIYVIISLTSSYSKNVYPYINQEYGGGRPVPLNITLIDGNLINSMLIHKDDKRYYLIDSNNAVTFIDVKKVSKIQK